MSTMTITAPLSRPRRASAPLTRPSSAQTLPAVPSRRRSAAVAVAMPARTSAPLQLTARGRAVLLLLLLLVALVASLATGAVSLAGTSTTAAPVRYVTVEAGQTLWAIAAEVAPSVDRRETIAQIRELNALASSAVQAGQQIAVPATR